MTDMKSGRAAGLSTRAIHGRQKPEPTTGAGSPSSSAQAVHHDLLSAIARRGSLVDVDAIE